MAVNALTSEALRLYEDPLVSRVENMWQSAFRLILPGICTLHSGGTRVAWTHIRSSVVNPYSHSIISQRANPLLRLRLRASNLFNTVRHTVETDR